MVLDLWPDRVQGEPGQLGFALHPDRALGVADLHVPKAPAATGRDELSAAVRAPRGIARALQPCAAHIDCAFGLRDDPGADVTGRCLDRERVGVGPAVSAQIEHRLARAVPGQLGLRSVGVVDAQLGHVPCVLGL